MSLLINELYKIKAEPEKYLEGDIEFGKVFAYIWGIDMAELAYNVQQHILGEDFDIFMKKRYGIDSSRDVSWDMIIERRNSGDGKSAYISFYYDLDAYMRDRKKGDFPAQKKNRKLKPDALYSYLDMDSMRKHPMMYIGGNEIKKMYFCIKGFITAESIICGSEELYNHPFDGPPDYNFTGFVKREYGIEDDVSWYKILEFKSRTQNEAFARFFDLLDRFRKTDE